MKRRAICEIPDTFVKQQDSDRNNKIMTQRFDFELITPMLGGDAESWILDSKNPVRGSSIKGQLRFWWRTMQDESDVKSLLFKENQRWGGKISEESKQGTIKSPISIAILTQDNIKTEIIQTNTKGNALGSNCIPNYVLFPVTSKVTSGETIKVISQLHFSLLISFPEKYQQEVMDTLTLWMLFGGVGARTRRGTGSLYCAELMEPFTTKTDIKNWLNQHSSNKIQAKEYARLTGSQLFINDSKKESSAQSVWSSLLNGYGEYRQDRREGQPPFMSRPGRSYWPEPDAIRAITRQSSASHENPVNAENWFPRAAFGLPILTKFSTSGDPTKGQVIHLEPDMADRDKSERYPSPMI